MKTHTREGRDARRRRLRIPALLLAPCLALMTMAASAQTPILSFDFNEGTADFVRDSINNLEGTPSDPSPTSIADNPSGSPADSAMLFEAGQYFTVPDPDTVMQLDPANPSFTLQAWVKFDGLPSTRMVFFYSNGPGGAISFSVNTDRTVFVTTLGILDANSAAAIPDDGEWHHIAVVHENGTELRYYVDGELADTRPYTNGVIFTRTQDFFTIGAEPGGGLPFVGSLDRLKVTSGILPPEEFDSRPETEIVDTDGDGMPDWWEIRYGLDPNDPSDAALDCNGNGMTNLDAFLARLDPCDATAPTIVSTASSASFDTVTITFSEDLDPATATAPGNYTITPPLAITAINYNRKVVTLTTAQQTPGGTAYTVAVTGVQDPSKNQVAPGTQARFFSFILNSDGILKFSYWGDIPGTPVINLYNDPRYPASPDWVGAVYSANSRDIFPNDSNDNYGATIEGYITPTESGSYRFFLRSDDASEFIFNPNGPDIPDPLMVLPDAEETGCCRAFTEPQDGVTANNPTTLPFTLTAGNRYGFIIIYKEGGGGDYAQLAWRREGDPTPAGQLQPIPGQFLSSPLALPVSAEGAFVTQIPAPDAVNVGPDVRVTIAHRDGLVPWTADNVSLEFNGVAVTPTFTKSGSLATITYKPSSLLASGSTHTITLGYPDPAGDPVEMSWSFTVSQYGGPVLDKVSGYPAILLGAAAQTADGGGHTGAAGDFALDTGVSAGVGYVPDATFLNAATADDSLSIAFFQKLRGVVNSSAFWANSTSSPSATRGFQAHVPWGDGTIYFDSSGCCDADITRISLGINNFPDYTGDATWWEDWHHFAFVKDGAAKRIYINGKLFHEGLGDPLRTDFTTLVMGGGSSVTENRMNGMLDEFVVYDGGLTEAQALSLSGGAAPSSIPGLIAHWDFNDVAAEVPTLSVTVQDGNLVITFDGTLQEADALGSWSDTTLTSPATLTPDAGNKFYRAVR